MKASQVTRTSLGVRNILFDEIDALKDGTSTPQKASTVAKLVSPIINSVKIEIEYQKYVAASKTPNLPVLNLGSAQSETVKRYRPAQKVHRDVRVDA